MSADPAPSAVRATRVLLLPGSLRAGSTNLAVLRTVAEVAPEGVEAVVYEGVADLPLYSPDRDTEPPPPAVVAWRAAVHAADALLLSTPEYAGALPAACKNALEWTVGDSATGSIHGKPVAWVNASAAGPDGAVDAHRSLRTVLGYVGAIVVEGACARVPVERRQVGAGGVVTDPAVRERLGQGLAELVTQLSTGASHAPATATEVSVARLAAADGAELVAAAVASRDLHQPWISPPDTPGRFAAYLERSQHDDQVAYVIRHASCGGLIGYVNVQNIVMRSFRSASVGYAAFAGHAGRGLMTVGLRLVIERAFTELGLHRLEANIQPGNAPSLALVRRLGFEREGYSRDMLMIGGVWRDHERWALRADVRP